MNQRIRVVFKKISELICVSGDGFGGPVKTV